MAVDPVEIPISAPGGDEASKVFITLSDAILDVVDSLDKSAISGEKFDESLAAAEKTADSLGVTLQDLVKAISEYRKSLAVTNEEQKVATVTTEESTKALESQAVELEANNRLLAERKVVLQESSVAQEAHNVATTASYGTLNKLSGIATPGILKAATWGVLSIGGIGYEAIKTYSKFNAELTQTITQAGRAPNSLPFLTNMALDVAKKTGVSLNDVANIIYRISSATAGLHGGLGATNNQLAKMTKSVAVLGVLGGVASGAPMEQSARVMGAMMNANLAGVGTSPAAIAAFINATVGAGDVKQSEIISALGRGALPTAAAHGVSAASLGSFIDLLTAMGTPGSTAGQYVKTALTMMTAPSAQGAKALAMLGIQPGDINQLLAGKGGIVAVSEYLKQALSRFNPTAFNVKYKGATGAAGATALLENWGVGDIPKAVIDAWAAGNLKTLGKGTAGFEGKSGTTWLNTLENLIVTKAFGGSKSSATIDAMINSPSLLAGIYASIQKNSSIAVLNRDTQRALSTPQAQFNMMKQTFMADLVNIGKALTPAALKLGKILTDVVGLLSRFKIVLIPLVSMVGVFAGIATVGKLASLAKGAYGVLGAGYAGTSKIWGKIAGKDIEGIAKDTVFRDLAKKLGGGGEGFKNVYMNNKQKQLSLLEDIKTNTAITAREGMFGGGGGGLEKTALSDVEKKALSEGKPVTKKLLRDLYSKEEGFGKGYSSKAKFAIDESFNKIKGIQGDALQSVGKAAISDTEKVAATGLKRFLPSAIAGFGETGIGGLAEMGLGFMGGPMGMAITSMLLPMAMPLVGKAISGVAGFFGGLFGGGAKNTYTPKIATGPIKPSDLKSQMLGDLAEIQGLQKKVANGTASAKDFQRLNFLSNQYANLSGEQKSNAAAWANITGKGNKAYTNKTFADINANKTAAWWLAYQTRSGQLNANNLNSVSQLGKFGPAETAALKALIWKGGPNEMANISRYINAKIGADKSALYNPLVDPGYYNAVNARKEIGLQRRLTGRAAALLGMNYDQNLTGGMASARYATFTRAAIEAGAQSKIDAKIAASGKLGEAASKELKEASAKLADQAKAYQTAAQNIAKTNKLTQADTNNIAQAVTTGLKTANVELGLTSNGMQKAFSAALGPGGLPGIISAVSKSTLKGTK